MFYTANKAAVKILNNIQYHCEVSFSGAECRTPNDATKWVWGTAVKIMQAELLRKHPMQIKTNSRNPANVALLDHWTNYTKLSKETSVA